MWPSETFSKARKDYYHLVVTNNNDDHHCIYKHNYVFNKVNNTIPKIYIPYLSLLMLQIQKDDKMVRRHIYYIFISPGPQLSRFFQQNILEAMKIIVIAKSRSGV